MSPIPRWTFVFAFTIATVAVALRAEDKPKRICPLKMSAYIGGALTIEYEVACNGFRTTYYARAYERDASGENRLVPRTETLKIRDEDWKAFREELDAAAVWDWEYTYVDPNTVDGTQWRVHIEYPDKRVRSGGSNKFPPGFDKFLSAVRKLTGRDFK